ncbi:TRAP transporter large permease [Dethiosulfatarculus sandiegensis]|uniref:ABC transporter permease n=1 Tax=Dethiosulfatarculus sandiegensis TaxID=1429043 RepID=A0A0D2GFP5_9BACT|nr:TRAP transporter large permease [Dethiosulfatarculus sandiegensis]KIX13757.1 ABC transporter permease [Dethiosulfatarculus sandiegensis]
MPVFILISFFILALIGLPVGIVVGLTTVLGFLYLGNDMFLSMLSQRMFSAMDSFTFLALPFFLLAGEIMNKVGLTTRLVDFSNLFFGRLKGGLAQVNIVTSIIFGGISGAAVADTAALGSIFIPAMTKQGYDKPFSTAVTVASSIIAPIIPPSIIMVLYGAIMEVSIAGLFAAGIVPGLMIGVALMILTRYMAVKRNYPTNPEKMTVKNITRRTKGAIWALLMPIVILGGILGGLVTPTEAAAVAVGLALFVGLVVYRNISFKELYNVFLRSAVTIGVITLLLSCASVLAWFLAIEQIPELVAKGFMALSDNRYVILLLINLFLILVGMFMDIGPSLLILGPILAPLAINLGVHPLHFGIMMCVNLNIALMTPPMGGCLFMGMVVSDLKLGTLVKALWPFILVEFAVLALVVYVPAITMTVPRWLGFVH